MKISLEAAFILTFFFSVNSLGYAAIHTNMMTQTFNNVQLTKAVFIRINI